MASYIVRLFADSSVRLTATPYVESEQGSFVFPAEGAFTVAVFDNLVPLGNVLVPRGLVINVKIDADDFKTAINHAQEAATYFLSMLSCVSNAAVGEPKPLWAYDATPGLTERDYRVFAYDANLRSTSRPLNVERFIAVLDKKFNVFAANGSISDDRKRRLARVFHSFRRAMAGTEDELDEFLIHWSSLEALDVVYREVFAHQPESLHKVCGQCKTPFTKCPNCGKEDAFVVGRRQTGVEEVFAGLNEAAKYDELRKLRNGISHGYMGLSECISTAKENIELVRRAVLSMIMRIIGVDGSVQAAILDQSGFKGKFAPHFVLTAKGLFEPGDVLQSDGHPVVEARCTECTAEPQGERLLLRPTWSFTNRNCALTYTGYELWGDKAANMVVTEEVTEVVPAANNNPEATWTMDA